MFLSFNDVTVRCMLKFLSNFFTSLKNLELRDILVLSPLKKELVLKAKKIWGHNKLSFNLITISEYLYVA
jgi:hypothetical protein